MNVKHAMLMVQNSYSKTSHSWALALQVWVWFLEPIYKYQVQCHTFAVGSTEGEATPWHSLLSKSSLIGELQANKTVSKQVDNGDR